MKCLKCGTENVNSKFCINCGSPLEGMSVESVKPTTTEVNNAANLTNGVDNVNTVEAVNQIPQPNLDSIVPNNQPTEIAPTNMENSVPNAVNIVNTAVSNGEQASQPITSSSVVENNSIGQTTSTPVVPNNLNTASTVIPPETNNNGVDYDFYDKPKKKKWPRVLIVIIILILALAGGYIFVMSKPKNNFRLNLYKYYTKLTNNMQDDISSISGSFDLSAKITAPQGIDEESTEIISIVNNLSLSTSYGIDYKNKIINFDFNTIYKNAELAKGNLYAENSAMYAILNDVTEKYLRVPLDSESYDEIFKVTDTKDSKVVLNSLKNAIDKSLKDEYFSKANAEITVDGKKVKAVQNIFTLKGTQISGFGNDVIEELKNDKDFIKSVKSITGEDISSSLKDILNQEQIVESSETFKVSFYTKPYIGSLLKVDLETISTSSNEKIEMVKENDNKYTIVFTTTDTNTNSNTSFDITIDISKENDLNVYKITGSAAGVTVEINIKSNLEYNKVIEKEDVTNYVDLDKMTSEEEQQIISKFQEKQGIKTLVEDIMKIKTLSSLIGEKNVLSPSIGEETVLYG